VAVIEEPKVVKEVEVDELDAWTTGYSDEQRAVALILRNAAGEEFGVMMPPEEAMAMGKQLSKIGLLFSTALSQPATSGAAARC
jgi:hypothetical protein